MRLSSTFALLILLATSVHAGKAHVHGVMSLDVVLDAGVLTLELSAPQDSLLGHERRPRTEAERQAAAAALARLRDVADWFRPDAAAGCVAGAVSLVAEHLRPAAAEPSGKGSHADVTLSAQWRCASPEALQGVDIHLFQRFARTTRIDVQLVGAPGPARQVLRPGVARLRVLK
jgi:hypothetical protein